VELFFAVGKAWAKKAGTEGGNSCPNLTKVVRRSQIIKIQTAQNNKKH